MTQDEANIIYRNHAEVLKWTNNAQEVPTFAANAVSEILNAYEKTGGSVDRNCSGCVFRALKECYSHLLKFHKF